MSRRRCFASSKVQNDTRHDTRHSVLFHLKSTGDLQSRRYSRGRLHWLGVRIHLRYPASFRRGCLLAQILIPRFSLFSPCSSGCIALSCETIVGDSRRRHVWNQEANHRFNCFAAKNVVIWTVANEKDGDLEGLKHSEVGFGFRQNILPTSGASFDLNFLFPTTTLTHPAIFGSVLLSPRVQAIQMLRANRNGLRLVISLTRWRLSYRHIPDVFGLGVAARCLAFNGCPR